MGQQAKAKTAETAEMVKEKAAQGAERVSEAAQQASEFELYALGNFKI